MQIIILVDTSALENKTTSKTFFNFHILI